jgi:hypothetical protein
MFERVEQGGRERTRRRDIPSPASRRAAGIACAMATVALIAGCGSSYTKSDFIARADAICASALRQTRSIAPTTALGEYVAAVVPIVQSEATELRALKSPPQDARDEAALAKYFGALTQEVENYRKLGAAAKRGDGQGVTNAEAALRASPAASLATGYGLRACGTPGATSA